MLGAALGVCLYVQEEVYTFSALLPHPKEIPGLLRHVLHPVS